MNYVYNRCYLYCLVNKSKENPCFSGGSAPEVHLQKVQVKFLKRQCAYLKYQTIISITQSTEIFLNFMKEANPTAHIVEVLKLKNSPNNHHMDVT
jgi:hypothetical protein